MAEKKEDVPVEKDVVEVGTPEFSDFAGEQVLKQAAKGEKKGKAKS